MKQNDSSVSSVMAAQQDSNVYKECEVKLAGLWFNAIWNADHDSAIGGMSHKFCTIVYSEEAVEHNLLTVNIMVPESRFRLANVDVALANLFSRMAEVGSDRSEESESLSPLLAPVKKFGRRTSSRRLSGAFIVELLRDDGADAKGSSKKLVHKRDPSMTTIPSLKGMHKRDPSETTIPSQKNNHKRDPSEGGVAMMEEASPEGGAASPLGVAKFNQASDRENFGNVAALFMNEGEFNETSDHEHSGNVAALFMTEGQPLRRRKPTSFGGVAEFLESDLGSSNSRKSREDRTSFSHIADLLIHEEKGEVSPAAGKASHRKQLSSFDGVAQLFWPKTAEESNDKDATARGYKASFGGVAQIFTTGEAPEQKKDRIYVPSFNGVAEMFGYESSDSKQNKVVNPSFGGVAAFLDEEVKKENFLEWKESQKKRYKPGFGGVAQLFQTSEAETSDLSKTRNRDRQSFGQVYELLKEESAGVAVCQPSFGGVADFFTKSPEAADAEVSGHGRKKSSFSGVVNLFMEFEENESSMSSEILHAGRVVASDLD